MDHGIDCVCHRTVAPPTEEEEQAAAVAAVLAPCEHDWRMVEHYTGHSIHYATPVFDGDAHVDTLTAVEVDSDAKDDNVDDMTGRYLWCATCDLEIDIGVEIEWI